MVCQLYRAFSIVPIFLLEISPPAFRSTFPGVTYQLGYMIALTSDPIGIGQCSTLHCWTAFVHVRSLALAKRFLVTFPPTEIIQEAPDFGILQAIFVGSAVAYLIPLALIGPENHGSRFERSKMAFQVGASRDEVDSIPEEVDGVQGFEMSSVWGEGFGEKGRPVH